MKYRIQILIENPENKDENRTLNLKCFFIKDDEGYGKKTYLSIFGEHNPFKQYIDLRYDKNYHRGQEKEYLEYWANNYWTGKNGSWEIRSLNITEVE